MFLLFSLLSNFWWLSHCLDFKTLSEDAGVENEETIPSSNILPWFTRKGIQTPTSVQIETSLKPGEYVMRNLFAEFIVQADKKITTVMAEPFVSVTLNIYSVVSINCKFIWRSGHCPNHFKEVKMPNLINCWVHLVPWLNTVYHPCSEYYLLGLNARELNGCQAMSTNRKETRNEGRFNHTIICLWQLIVILLTSNTSEMFERSEEEYRMERRDLAVQFILCLVLIEVLKQLPVHPGHEDLVNYIENLAFKNFKYREG